jgi:hypothetical protein
MPQKKNHSRRTYLLRCWQEGGTVPGQEPCWRFWLEEVLQGRRRQGFGNLEALFAFLRAELAGNAEEASDEGM